MRLIKAFLAGISGLFIVITLFSLLIPFNVRVSRAVLINNIGSAEVYRQIAHFENWKKWHPVFTVDGAKLIWYPPVIPGNDSGCIIMVHSREVKVRLISADTAAVKFLLQAKGENDIVNNIVITPLPGQAAIQVEWKAITKLHWYPWEKFYGIFIDKLTGSGYEQALNGLKEFLEKSAPSPAGKTGTP